jgi:hypothetical protein
MEYEYYQVHIILDLKDIGLGCRRLCCWRSGGEYFDKGEWIHCWHCSTVQPASSRDVPCLYLGTETSSPDWHGSIQMAALLSGIIYIVCLRIGFNLVRLSVVAEDEQHFGVEARLLVGFTRFGTLNKFCTAEYWRRGATHDTTDNLQKDSVLQRNSHSLSHNRSCTFSIWPDARFKHTRKHATHSKGKWLL